MSEKKKGNSAFLVQGSILAVASIVSRLIGFVYRVPLGNIIGNVGNDCYVCAYEIYNVLLLISSFSIPLVVSKLVAGYMSKGERRNAYRVFKCALVFALITGTIASLIVWFGAGFITSVIMATPLSYMALRVLGPTLVIVAVMGVIRGFFQGLGSMVPSAISQIIEQIVNAVVSVGAAYYLFLYGKKIGSILGDEITYGQAWGAAGGTLGTGLGALVGLIFLILILLAYMKGFKRRVRRHPGSNALPYRRILVIFVMSMLPVLLSTTIYNLIDVVNQFFFKNILLEQGVAKDVISNYWGIFGGKYKLLINVPIAIANALGASVVPSLAIDYAKKDYPALRGKIHSANHFSMMIAIPCAFGMAVLAEPMFRILFFTDTAEWSLVAARLMQTGAICIILFSLSTMSNAILQGINRMNVPVVHAVIATVVEALSMIICLVVFHAGVYSIIVAYIVFSGLMSLLNGMSIRKYTKYHQEWMRTFVIPVIASLIMSVVVWGVYRGCMIITNLSLIGFLLGIVAGVITYGLLLVKLKGITEDELLGFPKGSGLLRLFRKLHLM